METLPYEHIRWIENADIDLNKLVGTSDMKKIKDLKGNPLLLWVNSWSIGMTLDRNEGLELTEFGKKLKKSFSKYLSGCYNKAIDAKNSKTGGVYITEKDENQTGYTLEKRKHGTGSDRR